MKKIYTVLIAILISGFGFGQTTIAVQDYDGGTPNWNSTVFPATYNVSSDYWAIRGTNNNPSGTTGDFWAIRDLNNGNGGGNFDHTLTFDPIDISAYEDIIISFDFYTIGFESSDRLEYEIFYGPAGSEVGQGVVSLDKDTQAWTNISENIPDTADSAYIIITASQDGGSDYAGIDNVTIEGFLPTSETSVEFISSSASVSEGIGTFDLIFTITNEDAINATSFDVVLTFGDNSDINAYTTQSVTFPAGSSTDETLTITVTDDTLFEGNETLTFSIQNVTGGDNAASGSNSSFDLIIEENDPDPSVSFWCEPFDNNNQYSVTLGGEGNDGIQDYFQITDGTNINEPYSGANGTFFACQDIDDGGWSDSANPSQLTWNSIDVSNFSNLSFQGSFASNGGGIDDADFVLVEYQIDSGGWIDLLAFENNGASSNTSFLEDTDFNGDGDGTPLTTNFIDFSKSIGETGLLLDLRITVSLNSGDEEIAFDEFKILGIYSGLVYSDGSWAPNDPDATTGASDAIILDGNAILTTNASLNNVNVYPGAGLQVNSGATLTVNDMTLESTSTSYSSLIVDGSLSGSVSYERYVNTNDLVNGNDLISAPVSGQAFDVFISNNTNILANPSGPEVLFGGFDNNDNSGSPFEVWNETDTTPLTAGVGYRSGIDTAAGSNLVTFEGTVNTSLVEVAIDQGTASILNLIGNPFPSYLDAQAFLSENAGLLDPSAQVIYGYNDSTDGTSADDYTIISAIENNTLDIAPGQGFFVASNPTGGNIQFTTNSPDMRVTSTDDDFIIGRNSTSINNVNIRLNNSTDSYITKVYFTEFSGLGLDPGYDASLLGATAPPFALFSHLVQENMGIPFATQAIGKTDYANVTIPLGVNANQGEQLTFSIVENTLPSTVNVYLDDDVASTSTLLNSSDYVLNPATNLSGTGRFYLRFTDNSLSTSEDDFDTISIYANQVDRTINIAGQLLENTVANVYDIQGRLVTSKTLSSDSTLQAVDASSLSTGIYVIKLSNGKQTKTEKVILK
ncbi:T9SS type A sorting domain-containing protein [Winogradskyella luteola]|uniref:T9SS type A sorting domain-containing protein n=1 Tax=Winogradskyella luteola TaxID=2828330 RepID=A0A9X1JS47_9FLAO|nr:T9SS type A sorting domain-containing protein [Winogradskyella luteola]MBV7269257.1 T9SS type A sorting domain-containing protein [Winogradskyella luteola]